MNTAPAEPLYTPEEYRAFECDAFRKHEFFRGRIYAMSGANAPHVLICGNVLSQLCGQFRHGGDRYLVFNSDMRVLCPDSRETYPDLSICCGQPDFVTFRGTDSLRNPDAVVEVLSKSTQDHDRTAMFSSYKMIPSLREYLLVSHLHRRMDRYVRDGGRWLHEEYAPAGGHDDFPVLTARVEFAEAYRLTHVPESPAGPFRVVPATPEMQAADVLPPVDEAE